MHMSIPCPKTVAARRGYQDFENWKNYLCKGQWDEIAAKPNMAGEIIVTQMSQLGLKNPSEQTSASIAGGIAAAEHGEKVVEQSAQDMKNTFIFVKAQSLFQGNIYSRRAKLAVTTAGGSPRIVIIAMAWAITTTRGLPPAVVTASFARLLYMFPEIMLGQARIKQMAGRSNLLLEYVEKLPLAPRDFLQAHRTIALAVFSADRPPVACPLKDALITLARSKISIRGGSLMRNSLHVVSLECGYNRTRMYARTYMQQHCAHVCTIRISRAP